MEVLESLVGKMKCLDSIRAFTMLLTEITTRLGYQYCAFVIHCRSAPPASSTTEVLRNHSIVIGEVPPHLQMWLNDRLSVMKFCANNCTPILFGELLISREGASLALDLATRRETASSVVVPIIGHRGDFGCVVLGTRPSQHARRELPEKIGWYWMILAGYLYEAYLRCHGSSDIKEIKLTKRQRECLTLTAEGRTSKEIAEILGLSERTVNFHLSNCLQRTKSCKRQHAVSKCLQTGAI